MQKQPDAAPRAQTETPESGLALATKLAIELGPLLVFFGTNAAAGIYVATAVFMAATLVALGVAWWRYHKIPVMPLVSGAVVLVFGTLTLYLRDDTFIKLKPTIVYLTFAGVPRRRPLAAKAGARASARLGVQPHRARLAQAHAPLGAVLHRHGGSERARLAQCVDGCLGKLQGVRLPAAHLHLCHGPDAADAAL